MQKTNQTRSMENRRKENMEKALLIAKNNKNDSLLRHYALDLYFSIKRELK